MGQPISGEALASAIEAARTVVYSWVPGIWTGTDLVAEDAGLSLRHAQIALRELHRRGEVQRVRAPRRYLWTARPPPKKAGDS